MQADTVYSSMVRSGRSTYFIDVKESISGKRYLAITEHTLDAGDKRTRTTIRVFKESMDQFRQAVSEAIQAVNG
jgi:hypothetical protein